MTNQSAHLFVSEDFPIFQEPSQSTPRFNDCSVDPPWNDLELLEKVSEKPAVEILRSQSIQNQDEIHTVLDKLVIA